MSKSIGVDRATSKSPGMDTTMARHGYSDASFLLHRILHQKVRNMENLHGKIHAFVLVKANLVHVLCQMQDAMHDDKKIFLDFLKYK